MLCKPSWVYLPNVSSRFMTDNYHDTKSTINKPRKPFVAFLLSLLTPGLGQVYNGQFKKGLYSFLLLLVFPFLFGTFRLTTTFSGFTILVLLEFSLRIYIIVDAIINARKLKSYVPVTYNKWYLMLSIAIFQVIIFYLYDAEKRLGVKTFKIPTTSNAPTTNVGDCVVADIRAYNTKKVNYGDMIVFYAPDGDIRTYRAVGLPLDKVEIKDNELIINDKKCSTVYVNDTSINGAIHSKYLEALPNGFKHFILKNKQFSDTTISNMSAVNIPEFSYLLIGDNRDNAADSRFFGPINEQAIIGQLMFIYWSTNLKRISRDYRKSE